MSIRRSLMPRPSPGSPRARARIASLGDDRVAARVEVQPVARVDAGVGRRRGGPASGRGSRRGGGRPGGSARRAGACARRAPPRARRGTRPEATMSISSSSTTSAPARRSGPTVATSSRSTAPGSKERRSASLPPAATIARSGRNASAGCELARAHLGGEQVAAAEVQHGEARGRGPQRRLDAVDPREVEVAGVRLAHALGDAVAEHREALPGRVAQQRRQSWSGRTSGAVIGAPL